MPSAIALIPARSGSERVKDKNVRPLAGHPLLAYAIASARQSGIFDRVVCSTDSGKIAEVAQRYGADIPFLRQSELDAITGAAVRAAHRLGVPAPVLEGLLAEAEDACRALSR